MTSEMMKKLFIVFMTAMIVSAFACVQPDLSEASVKVSLVTKRITLSVGKSKSIKLKHKKAKAKYYYVVKNKKVASVSSSGKIKAKKAGSTIVTVKEKKNKKVRKIGTVKITVTKETKPQETPSPTVTPAPNPGATVPPAATNTPEVSAIPETSANPPESTYTLDYSSADNWIYCGENEGKDVDVFFVGPTCTLNDVGNIISMSDAKLYSKLAGAVKMERGIYDAGRFFSPYYNQASIQVYLMKDMQEAEQYYQIAYKNVRDAFLYYMEHYNAGRPVVLAGFSQGSEMLVRLMEEFYADNSYRDQLVAAYLLGRPFTQAELDQYPQLKPAQGECDTGVFIAFTCEAAEIETSFFVPDATVGYINPLNWRTDATPADKSLNAGACFYNTYGDKLKEIPELCGAYIDPIRGTLKVTDISSVDYPGFGTYIQDGVYHLYDYQFFYNNLRENVEKRITAYLNK